MTSQPPTGTTEQVTPQNPFPGIGPYQYRDAAVYFGRTGEARELAKRMTLHRGMMLFAASGVGKSSLINAGLIPAVLDEGFRPERVRVQPRLGQEFVVERIATRSRTGRSSLESIFLSDGDEDRVVVSATDLLEAVRDATDTWPLLIFDQFEEWITLFEEEPGDGQAVGERRAAQRAIRDAIATLLADRTLPVKVLLAFREDYLAKLAPLIADCPELADNFMRLEPLSAEQVYASIRGPYERFPDVYHEEIPASLAQRICDEFAERSEGGPIQLSEVQIVCGTLVEAAGRGEDAAQVFEDRGGVRGILEGYFRDTLAALPDDEREPAIAVLSRLITGAGTRNVVPEPTLLRVIELEEGMDAAVSRRALQTLEAQSRLVRRELRRGVPYYEIASEFLVRWIRQEAAARSKVIEERRVRAQLQRELAERRRKNRAIAAGVALIVLLAATVVVTFLALSERDARRHARAEALAAAALLEGPKELGALLAREAYMASGNGSERVSEQVDAALRSALESRFLFENLGLHEPGFWRVVPDRRGTLLAVAGEVGLEVWTLPARQRVTLRDSAGTFGQIAAGSYGSAAFSSDGRWLAVGDTLGRVWLWDLQNLDAPRRPVQLRSRHRGLVLSLAFSPDGSRLASGGYSGEILLHRPGQPAEAAEQLRGLSEGTGVWALAFAGNENRMISSDMSARVFDWNVRARTARLISTQGIAVAVSNDGRQVAIGSRTPPYVVTLRPLNGAGTTERVLRSNGLVVSLAFAPDDSSLVGGGLDSTVALWDLRHPTDRPLWSSRHDGAVFAAAFAGGSGMLASASDDGTVRVWRHVAESMHRDERRRFPRSLALAAIAPSQDAMLVMDRSDDISLFRRSGAGVISDTLHLWKDGRHFDLASGRITVSALATSDNGELLAAAFEDSVTVWRHRAGGNPERVVSIPHTGVVSALAFDPGGARLARASSPGRLAVFDLPAASPSWEGDHGHEVTAIAFDPVGQRLASGDVEGWVSIWPTAGAPAERIEVPAHEASVRALAFAPSGQQLASAGNDQTVRVWDLTKRRPEGRVLRGHGDRVGALAYGGGDSLLASGDDAGVVRVWNVAPRQPQSSVLRRHEGAVRAVTFVTGTHEIRSVGSDGTVLDWIIRPRLLADRICARVDRNLTIEEWQRFLGDAERYARTCSAHPAHPSLLQEVQEAVRLNRESRARALLRRATELDSALDADETMARYRARAEATRLGRDFRRSLARGDVLSALRLAAEVRALDQAGGTIPLVTELAGDLAAYAEEVASQSTAGADTALTVLAALDSLVGAEGVDAVYWNNVCWYASTWRRHAEALFACEHAVRLEPENTGYRDSRGLARALARDTAGAIADFRAFADDSVTHSSVDRAQRRRWIQALRAGRSPFTDEVLRALRN